MDSEFTFRCPAIEKQFDALETSCKYSIQLLHTLMPLAWNYLVTIVPMSGCEMPLPSNELVSKFLENNQIL